MSDRVTPIKSGGDAYDQPGSAALDSAYVTGPAGAGEGVPAGPPDLAQSIQALRDEVEQLRLETAALRAKCGDENYDATVRYYTHLHQVGAFDLPEGTT